MTMKTPEELADEYNKQLEQVPIMYYLPTEPCRKAFLAGYQAAKEHAHAALEEAEAVLNRLQTKLSDTGILTTEHLLGTDNSPEKPDGWISVKDRLPEGGESYLVLKDDGTSPYQLAIVWFDRTWDFPNADEITHWMRLPAPPEVK
jgi:hypothetical protein